MEVKYYSSLNDQIQFSLQSYISNDRIEEAIGLIKAVFELFIGTSIICKEENI